VDRFWSKTKRLQNGCLEWTGALKKPSRRDGRGGQALQHGVFWLDGRTEYAHRVARSLATGIPVRDLPLIGHDCDNPKCVEPAHLLDSSHSQNLQEAYDRGRRNLAGLLRWFEQNPITASV
jgi:hypothetical protein